MRPEVIYATWKESEPTGDVVQNPQPEQRIDSTKRSWTGRNDSIHTDMHRD